MPRQVGGESFEGRYFIVEVPDSWQGTDPLPPPSPADRWFDKQSEFETALNGPWIRSRVRRYPAPGTG
jgi:hypothetical protein